MQTLSIQEVKGEQVLILTKPNKFAVEFEVVCCLSNKDIEESTVPRAHYKIGRGKKVKVMDRDYFIDSDIGRKCKWRKYAETYRIVEIDCKGASALVLELETGAEYYVGFSNITFLDGE